MRKLVLLLTAMAALIVAAPASAATSASTAQATITQTGFVPRSITITENDSVKWTNVDTVNHQIVNLNGKVISPIMHPGDTFTKVFFSPGVYRYMDATDDTMRTTVTVRSSQPTAQLSVTLQASAPDVVFGGAFTLSGSVSSNQAGESVDIFAQRFGESSFSQVATVTSTAGGSWSYATKPMIETTYQAHWKTVTSPNAMVGVHPLVTLRVLAGKMRFSTRVVADRSFAGRLVRFQRRNSAGNWYTLTNVRLGSGSLAVFSARVPHGTSALRVYISQGQTGQGYLDGRSRTVIYSRA